MAFPKQADEPSEIIEQVEEVTPEYKEIKSILSDIEATLVPGSIRALFLTPEGESRSFLSFSHEEKLMLNATANTLKKLFVRLETAGEYKLEATDSRAGTSFSDITLDVSKLVSAAETIPSIFETLKSIKGIDAQKKYEETSTQKNMLLDFYFRSLGVSRAQVLM